MPATRIVAAALFSVFLLATTALSAQQPSFVRTDIATGVSLLGPVLPGDFNNDGIPDLLVASHSLAENFGIYILFGHGDGTFAQPFRAFAPPAGSGLGAADLNGDGTLDLLFLVGPEMWVMLGNGDGTFRQPSVSSHVPSGRAPLLVDLDRDGNLDAVFIGQDGPLAVSLGNGDGTFRAATSFPATGDQGTATALAAQDFNGDGFIDIVATNVGFSPNFDGSTVSVSLGNGDGTFRSPTDFPVGITPLTLATGDFNHDGRVDLAVSNYAGASLSVVLGRGDGTFLPNIDYPIGPFTSGTETADLNGDGRLDVAVCGPPAVLSIFAGRGNGILRARRDLAAAFDCEWMAVGDFNMDGRPDLALTYSSGRDTLSVFLNTTAPPDASAPTITASVTPSVLRPPHGETVVVVVSGQVTDAGLGVAPTSVRFAVRDSAGQVEPSGPVTIDAEGNYSVAIPLVASRDGRDRRTYHIVIRAKDRAGNAAAVTVRVFVPRDRRQDPAPR